MTETRKAQHWYGNTWRITISNEREDEQLRLEDADQAERYAAFYLSYIVKELERFHAPVGLEIEVVKGVLD